MERARPRRAATAAGGGQAVSGWRGEAPPAIDAIRGRRFGRGRKNRNVWTWTWTWTCEVLDLRIFVANRGSVGGCSTMVALLKDALRAAEEAAGKAAAFKPTTESTLERIRAAEEQAEEHGDSVKQSAQADVLMRMSCGGG